MNTVMKRTSFTRKQCIHREFRKKVKGMGKLQLAFTFSTKLIKRQLKAKIPYFRIRFQPPSLFQQAITKNRRILKLYDYCADSTNTTRFRIG